MGMSYKKAWDIVENLNSNSQVKLVKSFKGGAQGGRAEVTKYGKELVTGYQQLTKKLNQVLDKNKNLIRHI